MLTFSVLAMFALFGCGPSGTSSFGGTELFVDAGQDKNVAAGHDVSLHGMAAMTDGSTSFDVSWTQVEGDVHVSLRHADTFNPVFTSPHVHARTLLLFSLHVKSGDLESTDAVGIFVLPTTVPQVLPPHPITTHTGSNVTIQSTALPPAGDHTLTHEWTQVSGPSVTLSQTNATWTSFVAPAMIGPPAPVVLHHTVANTGTGTLSTVPHVIHLAPPTKPLYAIVTPPQIIYEGVVGSIHLSVSGGTKPYGYVWTQTHGASLPLDTTDPLNPTFLAPQVAADELIELQVVVTDGVGKNLTLRLPMTVKDIKLHLVVQPRSRLRIEHTLKLFVSPVRAPDEPRLNPITYVWSEVNGDSALISDGDTDNPTVSFPPGSGTYLFKVDGIDSAGNKDTARTEVWVDADIHVNAGTDFSVFEDTDVTMSAVSVGTSNAGTFLWTQLTGPTVVLRDPTTLNPGFRAPFAMGVVLEPLAFRLTVTEGGKSSADDLVVAIMPNVPAITMHGSTSIPNGSDGFVLCNAVGGVPPFTFEWSVIPAGHASAVAVGTDTASESRAVVHAGHVTTSPAQVHCKVTDSRGRVFGAFHSISIFEVPAALPLSVTISASTSILETSVGVLAADARGGSLKYTYKWTITPADKGTILSPGLANAGLAPNPVDTHGALVEVCVAVTDGLVSTPATACTHVTINDVPLVVGVIAGPQVSTSGDTVSLSVRPARGGAGGPYRYQWYQNGSAIGTSSISPTISFTAPPVELSLGRKGFAYSVEVTDIAHVVVRSNDHDVVVSSSH